MKANKNIFVLVAVILLVGAGDESFASDVLRYLQACSDVIIVGEITVAPDMVSGSAPIPSQKPVPYWQESFARIKVSKVLKGRYAARPDPLVTLRIPMVASTSHGNDLSEMLAPFAKGSKFIFFLQDRRVSKELGTAGLNDEPIHLVAFEQFLSLQPYSEALELEIGKNAKYSGSGSRGVSMEDLGTPSPLGKYYAGIHLDNSNRVDTAFGSALGAIIDIYDKDCKVVCSIKTKSTTASKNTLGWMKGENIVIFKSDDVETMAFRLEQNGMLVEIPVTDAIQLRANELATSGIHE